VTFAACAIIVITIRDRTYPSKSYHGQSTPARDSRRKAQPDVNKDQGDKRLLIVEDDNVTRKLLQQVLKEAGFQVMAVGDASGALTALQQEGLPHLVILDLGLPGMDGFELSEHIKRMGDVPIIILTGNSDEAAKIHGIERYADDYITKPFNVKEIVARIQRVLSRINDFSYAQGRVTSVDTHLSIDFASNRAWLDGQDITLTPIETNLLQILLRNKGQVVSPETLLARVWPNEEVYEETLRVHMSRLRRKLHPITDQQQYIYTERGAGYTFHVPENYKT
jgi:DNA-binding response OmpR family regulator